MLQLKCKQCFSDGSYTLEKMVEADEKCRWLCIECGHELLSISRYEREQMLQGMKLIQSHVPDLARAYEEHRQSPLPSNVRFGRVKKE
ncbi:hypothetical protein J2T17_004579 [Paenibacillus mucilaginosus]|uniref:hypothetical protein n=1 Tax=Paenibacillus mucilaginosus TaxID=61624 RepID=UPI003D24244E